MTKEATVTIQERLDKLEAVLEKEIKIYNSMLDQEYKKMNAILENRLQDLDMYCDYQTRQIQSANDLGEIRKRQIDAITMQLFPQMFGTATLKDIVNRMSIKETIKISALRLELKSVVFRLKKMNTLVPKLLDQGYEIFKNTRELLSESRKIGYNNRGKESVVKDNISLLLNKQV